MGFKEVDLYLFNLYDIDTGKYAGYNELVEFGQKHNIKVVPLVAQKDFGFGETATVSKMLEVALALNYDNGTPAEGIVWRSACETYSEVLKGRMSFKTISNRFLEKYKE
jgi:hypothetical protein